MTKAIPSATFSLRFKARQRDGGGPPADSAWPRRSGSEAFRQHREIRVTAPPDVMVRVQTFITVMDWPDKITRQSNFEYPRDTVLHAARCSFRMCDRGHGRSVFQASLPPVLAELKGDTKSKSYSTYLFGGSPDPEWEKSLRTDWPGKKEAIGASCGNGTAIR